MSTNVFARLRALLPPEPVIVARVVEHHADDTSTVELPLGFSLVPVDTSVSTGNRFRARGTNVPVDSNAFVRGNVIQSQAPDGDPNEVATGFVIESPLGPTGITALAVPAQATSVGVAFSLDLNDYFTQFYAPLSIGLAAGSLTGTGLALAGGVISGTPSGAASITLTARGTDATGLTADTTVNITVS